MLDRPLFLLASLLAYAVTCHGHAFLLSPRSRALVLGKDEYTVSAGNGLGTSPYRKNPDGSNLNDQPDVCGDPHQDAGDLNLRGTATAIQATYAPGSIITVTFRARVNHGGWFGVRLCPSTRTNPTQACFDQYILTNADTGYPRWWITNGKYLVQQDYATRWRLPAGVSCDGGCVLQMIYRTANSCVDPCTAAECGASYAARNNVVTSQVGLQACGGAARTEVFRDCADIKISGTSSGTAGPSPSPSPTSSPRASPSPSPSATSAPSCGQTAAAFCAGRAAGWYGDKCSGCSKYYWCYGTGAVLQSCPAGTTMDSRGVKSYCDWPQNNVC